MPELKSILIVGGSGFLGTHLIEEFWNHKPRPEIHVFDIRGLPKVSSTFFSYDASQIIVHLGDLTKAEDVIKVIEASKPQVIVHSASPVHGLGKEIYHKVNVEGTANLIECAKKLSVPALVYTSSAGAVFNGEDIYNADESIPFPDVPMDAYNETKATAEQLVLKAASKDFYTVALRPAGIFGPGDRQMIPNIRNIAFRGSHRFQLGNNLNLFDLTYVGNVALAHALAADKILDPNERDSVNGQKFFITNDSPIYFWSLARAVWKSDGFTEEARVVLPRSVAIGIGYISEFFSKILNKEPGLTPFRVRITCASRYYNISKAKTILDYKPRTDLDTAIKNTLLWLDEEAAAKKI